MRSRILTSVALLGAGTLGALGVLLVWILVADEYAAPDPVLALLGPVLIAFSGFSLWSLNRIPSVSVIVARRFLGIALVALTVRFALPLVQRGSGDEYMCGLEALAIMYFMAFSLFEFAAIALVEVAAWRQRRAV